MTCQIVILNTIKLWQTFQTDPYLTALTTCENKYYSLNNVPKNLRRNGFLPNGWTQNKSRLTLVGSFRANFDNSIQIIEKARLYSIFISFRVFRVITSQSKFATDEPTIVRRYINVSHTVCILVNYIIGGYSTQLAFSLAMIKL